MYLGPMVIGAIVCFGYYFLCYRPKHLEEMRENDELLAEDEVQE